MTLTDTFSDNLSSTGIRNNSSTNLESLYCSHLWSNSDLRKTILNAPDTDCKAIKYCYTCKGKIRNYVVKSSENNFDPSSHSTPKGNCILRTVEPPEVSYNDNNISNYSNYIDEDAQRDIQCIPSISRQVDSSFRQKFTDISFDSNVAEINQRRLRKSLKGIGCVVNFALTEKSLKKRTQIQAFSISVMIVAIVVISLILVNFTTPNFTPATNVTSTIVVPTRNLDFNETSSAIVSIYPELPLTTDFTITEYATSGTPPLTTTQHNTLVSNVIAKIRKNIKTFPKDVKKNQDNRKPIDIINRDLPPRFCSCQRNEVCMLDENTGTSICKHAVDMDDPTGCGGLCALETEACQLVDRIRGVRVCRLLSLVTCSSKEWRCRNGLCVPAESRCDGSVQCYDRSDEMHCDCDLTKQFRCGQSISCFPNKKLCDGIIDCWDGYDEVNCTTECPEDQFTCTDGQCIMSSRFCDGLADCGDGSDEPQGCEGACSGNEIRCKNKRCVPRASLCDGRDDCGDGTDELHCS
ncbi:uncharacterized protein [Epargyreus clarus]